MALPELLDALRRQAAQRRAEELARAGTEAERVRAESRASLDRRRLAFVERIRREEEEVARRAVSRAQKGAAESVLAARDRLLARVAEAVAARAGAAVSDPEYLARLPAELRSGLERLPPGDVVVRVPPELSGRVRDELAGLRDLQVVPDADMGTGFTACVAAAGVEVDGTLATRLSHAWADLAVQVLREVAP
jgi:vacuolar-type H+-ATPase subunit E/Vma4